ncbi:MAG: hypothetical protein ACXWCH_34750 [Burkholderiales bacterium]
MPGSFHFTGQLTTAYRRKGRLGTSASPTLVFTATALSLMLAMLEIDLHRDELRALVLFGGEEASGRLLLGPELPAFFVRAFQSRTSRVGLAEEATVFVVLNDIQKFLNRCHGRHRLITVPFEIGAPPQDLPIEFALVVGCLGKGLFERLAFIPPVRTQLEYLDALPADTECKVNFRTEMRRRSPLFNEFGDQLFAALNFKLRERHLNLIGVTGRSGHSATSL